MNKAINSYITKFLFSNIIFLIFATMAFSQTNSPGWPFQVEILQAPTLAIADGQKYIVYELHLTSFYRQPFTLQNIEVISATDTSKILLEYKDEFLTSNLKYIGPMPDATKSRTLDYGRRVVLFAWIPLKNNSVIPSAIRHRITITLGNSAKTVTMLTASKIVDRRIPVVIHSPLKGSSWLAGNGPQPKAVTDHNRLLAPLFGQIQVPSRYATDWVKFGPDGKLFRKNIAQNEDWYGYGEPVIAVADGIITEVIDGVPENRPPELTTPLTQQTVAGNYIMLKIGKNRYAIYGHLKPGSIRFKKGQHVKRGEVLGLVGNSGNSTGPHLHFQLVNAPFTIAEGIPFIFNTYEQIGTVDKPLDAYTDEGAMWQTSPWKGDLKRRNLPLNGTVVNFLF